MFKAAIAEGKRRFDRNWSMISDHRSGLFRIWIMLLALSVLDLFSIALVGVLVVVLFGPEGSEAPGGFDILGMLKIEEGDRLSVLYVTMILFVLKSGVVMWLQQRILKFGATVQSGLIRDVAQSLHDAPYSFHLEGNSSARIKSAITSTGIFVNHSVIPGVRLTVDMILATVVVLFLAIASPVPTFAVFGVVVIVGVLYTVLLRRRTQRLGKEYLEVWEHLSTDIRSLVMGIKELRVYGTWPFFRDRIDRQGTRFSHTLAQAQLLRLVPRYLFELVLVVAFLGACVLSVVMKEDPAKMLGVAGMFLAAGMRLMPAASSVVIGLNSIANSESASQDLYDILHPEEKGDKPMSEVVDSFGASDEGGQELPELFIKDICGSHDDPIIELEGVSFSYPEREEKALYNVDFSIPQGATVGVYGTSGSGKSTLLDMMLGFHEPSEGIVCAGGKKIFGKQFRKLVSYVPQSPILLDESVRSNVAFGIAMDEIDDKRVLEALKCAQLENFLSRLPEGLDSRLGENASTVSGGQRQRLALARAFYQKRPVLILDEGTSAVDLNCENELLKSIANWEHIKGVLLVGHRPELFSHCNRLYRMESGCATLAADEPLGTDAIREFLEAAKEGE